MPYHVSIVTYVRVKKHRFFPEWIARRSRGQNLKTWVGIHLLFNEIIDINFYVCQAIENNSTKKIILRTTV